MNPKPMKWKCLAVMALSLASGCDTPAPKTVKINVERVFQQRPGCYSFLVRTGTELVPKNEYNYRSRDGGVLQASEMSVSHLFTDVPPGEPMFVEFRCGYQDYQETCEISVHVHSAAEIDTTGYTVAGNPPVTVHPKVIE